MTSRQPPPKQPDHPVLTCRQAWEQMTEMTRNGTQIRNYHTRIDMTSPGGGGVSESNGYTVETDLFPKRALAAYSAYNLGDDVSEGDRVAYFSAHRGGSQGDYRAQMKEKIDNVADCLVRYPSSKRAVITVPNTSTPDHARDDDAKCMREIHFYIDEEANGNVDNHENEDRPAKTTRSLNATVWMRAQAAEIFPKNIHFIGSLMQRIVDRLNAAAAAAAAAGKDGMTTTTTTTTTTMNRVEMGELFYLATTLVSDRW